MLESKQITIVSGLPRSGTSLMMQMLHAGGMEAVTDGQRTADTDNPRGYFEFERAKKIKTDRAWLDDAQGRCVKMVHLLLLDLPMDRPYAVVFMRRDLNEVVKSQAVMLQRSGKTGAALPAEKLMAMYKDQIDKVLAFAKGKPNVRVLEVNYNTLVKEPARVAAEVGSFVGGGLNEHAMAAAVDPTLYRNRG